MPATAETTHLTIYPFRVKDKKLLISLGYKAEHADAIHSDEPTHKGFRSIPLEFECDATAAQIEALRGHKGSISIIHPEKDVAVGTAVGTDGGDRIVKAGNPPPGSAPTAVRPKASPVVKTGADQAAALGLPPPGSAGRSTTSTNVPAQ